MPAKAKLTDEQVKRIRRRVSSGERIIDLADELDVNRKTIWRRLDALARTEAEKAAKRLRGQAARERRELLEHERGPSPTRRPGRPKHDQSDVKAGAEGGRGGRSPELPEGDPFLDWLDRPKNLSGRAFAEARGLVRVRNPEGTVCLWCERSEVDALFEAGWTLA